MSPKISESPRASSHICSRVQELGANRSLAIAANDGGSKFFNYAFRIRLVTLPPSFEIVMNNARSGTDIEGAKPVELRGFWALIITQFQGAFSDNALKWLAVFLI